MRADQPPVAPAFDAPGVEVFRDVNGALTAVVFPSGGHHALLVPRVGTFILGKEPGTAHLHAEDSASDDLISDAFHRIAIPFAVQLEGTQVLHASAVRGPHGVVALCGRSGTGKSTLAFALARRGQGLAADDAVGFRTDPAGPVVVPLPFRLRLRPSSAAHFDALEHLKGRERSVPFDCTTGIEPFRALFVLSQREAGMRSSVRVTRLEPAEAFSAVLPHAYYVTLDDARVTGRLVDAYLDLARALPVFAVEYSHDLTRLDDVVSEIEQAERSL